jgi:hypothetical protein
MAHRADWVGENVHVGPVTLAPVQQEAILPALTERVHALVDKLAGSAAAVRGLNERLMGPGLVASEVKAKVPVGPGGALGELHEAGGRAEVMQAEIEREVGRLGRVA